jgi:hypothetical protein
MASNKKPGGPFGGWFGTLGGFVGMALGWDASQSVGGAIAGLVIGAYVGLAVEHLVWKLLLIGGAILFLLVRHEILKAFIESLK